ncbi:AraC family transcriptional regulator [Enterococcus silesiacus]|uniref:AraC family transcriptional regulator n=1 Tax=Enterococcus silesiacus TaxID=332949 RepID=A0A0S3KCZ7_9ENTE|nr:response regulator [Enterococcus silesiacus]ALS02098.1 AraC family transcriptional regulator [Enterococcus silesiacus]OJG91533.1 AraC family transcriptional regulator [Enterococcus silesiacus]
MYKILVVEDEPLVRKGIVTLIDFKRLEIDQIFEAGDGKKALEIVAKESPHIILTDINLPYLDGLTFAKKVKLLLPKTVIIFLTGYDYFEYAVSALKLGADDYILKPVTKQDVEELLTQAINKLKSDLLCQQLNDVSIARAGDQKEGTLADTLKQTIEEQLSNPLLSLTWLAHKLGYNSSYLSSVIKKTLGTTFQDYVSKKRIEQAKVLLLATTLKNYEIAGKVGFEDVNYFSLRFKQVTGLSPRQYKKEAVQQ